MSTNEGKKVDMSTIKEVVKAVEAKQADESTSANSEDSKKESTSIDSQLETLAKNYEEIKEKLNKALASAKESVPVNIHVGGSEARAVPTASDPTGVPSGVTGTNNPDKTQGGDVFFNSGLGEGGPGIQSLYTYVEQMKKNSLDTFKAITDNIQTLNEVNTGMRTVHSEAVNEINKRLDAIEKKSHEDYKKDKKDTDADKAEAKDSKKEIKKSNEAEVAEAEQISKTDAEKALDILKSQSPELLEGTDIVARLTGSSEDTKEKEEATEEADNVLGKRREETEAAKEAAAAALNESRNGDDFTGVEFSKSVLSSKEGLMNFLAQRGSEVPSFSNYLSNQGGFSQFESVYDRTKSVDDLEKKITKAMKQQGFVNFRFI